MERLFCASVMARVDVNGEGQQGRLGKHITVADEYALWWDPKDPNQTSIWESKVLLSEAFFSQVIDRPVPVDLSASFLA